MTTTTTDSTAEPTTLSSQHQQVEESSPQCPFHVLGIALVVDEIGKGARLAFRYPLTPTVDTADTLFFTLPPRLMAKLFRPKKPLCGQPMTISVGETVFCCRAVLMEAKQHGDGDSIASSSPPPHSSSLDLFNVVVALAPSVPASTIPIAGWTAASDTAEPNSNQDDALSISSSSYYLAIRRVHVSIGRLCRVLEREERRCQYVSLQASQLFKIQEQVRQEIHQRAKLVAAAAASSSSGANSVDAAAASVSETTQTSGKQRRSHRRGVSGGGSTMTSIISTAAAAAQVETGDHHHHPSTSSHSHHASPHSTHEVLQEEVEQEILERLLATSLSSSPTNDASSYSEQHAQEYHHHGNLARELVQVYHALAWNEDEFLPTASILLNGASPGIVYVNLHIAVCIEPAAVASKGGTAASAAPSEALHAAMLSTSTASNNQGFMMMPRSYQTLLFPHASPKELVQTLLMSNASSTTASSTAAAASMSFVAPQRLQQLLLMVNPRKSLLEISMNSALPLAVTLELAAFLVVQGASVLSSVLTRSTRLACINDNNTSNTTSANSTAFLSSYNGHATRTTAIGRMQECALDFSQEFGLSIFHVVSVLTSGLTLGEVMAAVAGRTAPPPPGVGGNGHNSATTARNSTDRNDHHRTSISPSSTTTKASVVYENAILLGRGIAANSHLYNTSAAAAKGRGGLLSTAEIEEVVYALAVWLRSHEIVIGMEEYLVPVMSNDETAPSSSTTHGEKQQEHHASFATTGSTTDIDAEQTQPLLTNNSKNGGSTERSTANLYKQLLQVLRDGNVSTVALCWRFDLDSLQLQRFRAWGIAHNKLRALMRVPRPKDDWNHES